MTIVRGVAAAGWPRLAALRRDATGAVVAMAALMATALAGFTALAVDVGLWYATQARMQNAADAAALAGALELARSGYDEARIVAAASEGATRNGFDPADGSAVAVGIAADGRSVQVQITGAEAAMFAKLFLPGPVAIRARAAAALGGGTPICLLALDSSSSASLYLDSNAKLHAPDCAVQVNSSSSTALHIKSNSGIRAASVCVTGGYRDESTGTISPTPETGCPREADPLAGLAAPSTAGCGGGSGLTLDNATTTLNPGVYCDGLTIKGNSKVTFKPGIYVIKDNKFFVDSNSKIEGDEVGFYLKGSAAVIEFNSNSIINLTAPSSGPMGGILFFHDRTVTGMPVHRIDSNSNNKTLNGMLYFPNSKLLVDSNGAVGGSLSCTLMIARRFEFNSNSVVKLNAELDACPLPVTTAYAGGGLARLLE